MSRRPVDDHRRAIAELLVGLAAAARVRTSEASGLVLAEPVDSPVSLPPFDNSAMDGFAVRADEIEADRPLPVAQRIPAGTAPPPLAAGTVAAIMTGAPVPDGADAVIPVEESLEVASSDVASSNTASSVTFTTVPQPGAFIRRRGSDVVAGDRILEAGTRLAPHHLGALAAAGVGAVTVRRRPRVAILSTGSELVPAGSPLGPGQIYESNATLLAALVRADGSEPCWVDTVGDDGGFGFALDAACTGADVVITTGGVSAGEHEPVRDLLSSKDSAWFGAVAMQPGGPQGIARWRDTPVICLPGNPVSVLVSFEVFVRPALRTLLGHAPVKPTVGRVSEPARSIPGKTQFLRARRLEEPGLVQLISGPSSHLIATAAQADVLVEVDAAITELTPDLEVPLWPLTT